MTLRKSPHAIKRDARYYETRCAALERELRDAEAVCDEWEIKNGDAPHRVVRLADRIRVNAGLQSGKEGQHEC